MLHCGPAINPMQKKQVAIPLAESIPATKLPLTMVVASTPTGVIGNDGSMPWRLGTDLVRFKKMTMGGTLVMGRKTFDSIGRPLPGRQTIVLTRQSDWSHPGVHVVQSPQQAVEKIKQIGTAGFIVGGAEIYRLFLPSVDQIWLTVVWSNVSGDTRIELGKEHFRLIESSRYPQTAKDSAPTELQKWVRKKIHAKNSGPH
jgi:dihydrofolate reductase